MGDHQAVDGGEPDAWRPLRLIAMDAEDLSVVSAHLQDALVRVADMIFQPTQRRFALVADRFDWCAVEAGRMERRRVGLHFEGVLKASYQGLEPSASETVMNLLSISFVETEAPTGVATLTFSGGAAIRLEVECVEAQMRDMGPRWPVTRRPGHDDVKDAGAEQ
jgi:Protein of unknown function (DUF2948)